jgi:hypothetical protein
MKPGENVEDVLKRLEGRSDKLKDHFDKLMGKYGDMPLGVPLDKIGNDLELRVRNSVGIGYSQNEEIANYFRKELFNNDVAELARQKLLKQGYTDAQIKASFKPDGKELYMDAVYHALGNQITLKEIDSIKRNMWKKTGLFRRNAGSMQRAGTENTAGEKGGFATLDFLNNLSEREEEILMKIGGEIDGELTDVGIKYIQNKINDNQVPGKVLNHYNKINKARSEVIGKAKIFNGSLRNLERNGMGDMKIYPESEWRRIAKEKAKAVKADKNYHYPEEKIGVDEIEKEKTPFMKLFMPQDKWLDRVGSETGQRLGRMAVPPQRNSLGLTPPRQ